jgi:DNA repair exonuclease SbcCD nuclease subunit
MIDAKWAIFTDLHLGVHQNSSSWHKIALDWADWFIADLKEKGITQIIFTGDFFHSRSEISVSTIHVAAEFISKFSDFDIKMIVGNHDSYYKQKADVHSLSILNGYKNIQVFDTVTNLAIGGRKVCFCPWGFEYDKIEKSDLLFGHFEIETFKMNAHKLCDVGSKPKDLLKKAPLVFSGHFHLNEERQYDEGTIVYVGSPFQLDFGERDCKKGYYLFDFSSMQYEFVENKQSPTHRKLLLSDLLVKDKIDENKLDILQNNFVKLVVDVNVEQKLVDNLIHLINSKSPASMTVDPLVSYDIMDQENTDLSGVDIGKAIVEFVNLLDIKEKEPVIKRTLELYNQSRHG